MECTAAEPRCGGIARNFRKRRRRLKGLIAANGQCINCANSNGATSRCGSLIAPPRDSRRAAAADASASARVTRTTALWTGALSLTSHQYTLEVQRPTGLRCLGRGRRPGRHRSTTTSPTGREQQMSTLPVAGKSSGWGSYATFPETRPLSQLWQTPARHAQRTGMSHASASSSTL